MAHLGGHAVVIGASMGGLLAARALADHYDQVTIVERDALPEFDEPRKGVPQGRHTHGLLARGREVLEELFPGLSEELAAEGAVYGDVVDQVLWFQPRLLSAQRPEQAPRPAAQPPDARRRRAAPAAEA